MILWDPANPEAALWHARAHRARSEALGQVAHGVARLVGAAVRSLAARVRSAHSPLAHSPPAGSPLAPSTPTPGTLAPGTPTPGTPTPGTPTPGTLAGSLSGSGLPGRRRGRAIAPRLRALAHRGRLLRRPGDCAAC
jgi:hypothetical protein